MYSIRNFHKPASAAVIGASGGIGSAIVRQLAAAESVGRVFAFSRRPNGADDTRTVAAAIDLSREASIREAAAMASADGPLDLVIVASGILHRGDALRPEKSMRELDGGSLAELFAVNAIGPALVAKYFLPALRPKARTVFAALSARVGSIGDNRLGGWAGYRASKAALNMLLRTLSIEQARRRPETVVVALHPGTVDTALSKPFTGRVPEERLFSPEQSADHLLRVIDGLQATDTGGFFAWDGQRIEY